jgi:Nitrate reductase alpha subunit
MLEIADKFIDHSVEHGPEAITCGLGTQMVMKRASYASIMRFANITGVQMPEAFAGVGDLFSGAQIPLGHVPLGNPMAEIYNSQCCLIWFCIPAVTRIPDAPFFWEAKYHGTEVISISPDFNATAMPASKWLIPKPGSDIALAMAMIETFISDQSYDEDYMREPSVLPFLVRKDHLKYLRETDLPPASADAKDIRFYFWDEKNDQLTEAPGTGTPPVPPPGTPEHLIPPMPSIALQGLNPAIEGSWIIETKDGPVEVPTVFDLVKQRSSAQAPEYAEEITGIPLRSLET